MDERARRIVETAVALAERDGYAAVRLRDVAAQANVALGTVYKRFSSKEEILVAALEQEAERLGERLIRKPIPGETRLERVETFFTTATNGLTRKPNLARALFRAIASADRNIHDKVASFHAMTTMMVIAALRGVAPDDPNEWGGEADQDEREIARVLQHVWFASLVGWAGGVHDVEQVIADVMSAARMICTES